MTSTEITSTQMSSADINSTDTNLMETTSMATRQLHSSQKEAMKKIAEFSGESNELDVDEWLFDLTNLFTLMKLKDETKILETMGKLTGPALRWYQENLTLFTDWKDAEQALKNRFKDYTSNSQIMKEFFQIQQEENQTLSSFYETVIRKYRKANEFITEQQVITVLQNGVKHSLKEYLIRNEKSITKPEEWLKFAKEEESIQRRLQQQHNNSYVEPTTQPNVKPVLPTATVQPRPINRFPRKHMNTTYNPNRYQHRPTHQFEHNRTYKNQNQLIKVGKKEPKVDSCLVCNRKNHPTNQCYYKKENGCFKCGQSNHRIRDCPKRHFFE